MEGEKTYTYTTNHPLIIESTRPENEVDGTLRAVGGFFDAHTLRGGFFWGGATIFSLTNSNGLFFPAAPDFFAADIFSNFQISNKDDKTR